MRSIHGVRLEWIGRAAALAAVVGVPAHPTPVSAQAQLTVDVVVARAAAYVETFVEELSTVVMEEDYRQIYFRRSRDNPVRRHLVSEFLLMRVHGVDEWVGFRDVFEIDGRRIRDRQDRLASLFQSDTSTALAQARRIAQESSRYNLGSATRTFNVPTSTLFYLHPSNIRRSRFEKEDERCGDQDTAWDIRFEEIEFPTLSRGFEGISLPAHGRFCVDPVSGRVFETELELHHPSTSDGRLRTDAKVQVRFALDERLNLWVPIEMRDSYAERGGGSASSTAKYRNYRQFSVTVSENTDPQAGPDGPK